MAGRIDIDFSTSSGKTMDDLSRIIQTRRKELGETTEQSLLAITQTLLRSLRALTKTANLKSNNIILDDMSGRYYTSWMTISKGNKKRKRVLRDVSSGKSISDLKVIWDIESGSNDVLYKVFKVTDEYGDKKDQYMLVSKSLSQAKRYAQKRARRRLNRYKGLAKLALALARKKLFGLGDMDSSMTSNAESVAQQNVTTSVKTNGYNSGDIEITVHDKLKYALDALQNGQSTLDICMQKAIDSQIGYLKKKIDGLKI